MRWLGKKFLWQFKICPEDCCPDVIFPLSANWDWARGGTAPPAPHMWQSFEYVNFRAPVLAFMRVAFKAIIILCSYPVNIDVYYIHHIIPRHRSILRLELSSKMLCSSVACIVYWWQSILAKSSVQCYFRCQICSCNKSILHCSQLAALTNLHHISRLKHRLIRFSNCL